MVDSIDIEKFLAEFLVLKNNITSNTGDWNFGTNNLITTGDIILDSDSSKIYLGDDQDMEIYHDGTKAYIRNLTGNMNISSTGGTICTEGEELIDDPEFNTSGDWTLGNGWSVTGGALVHGETAGGIVTEASPIVAVVGGIYLVSAVVTVDSGSGVAISFDGQTLKVPNVQATGTFSAYIKASSTTGLNFDNDMGGTGGGPVTITSCSVKRLTDLELGNLAVMGDITELGAISVTGRTGTLDATDWKMEGGAGGTGGDGADFTIKAGDSGDSGEGSAGTVGDLYLYGGDSGDGAAPNAGGNAYVIGGTSNGEASGGNVYIQGGPPESGGDYGEVYLGAGPGANPEQHEGSVHLKEDYKRLYFGAADDAYLHWHNINGQLQTLAQFGIGADNVKFTLGSDAATDSYIEWDGSSLDFFANGGNFEFSGGNAATNVVITSGTDGDATLTIKADTNNSTENDHPQVKYEQDGAAVTGYAGYETVAGHGNNSLWLWNNYNEAIGIGLGSTVVWKASTTQNINYREIFMPTSTKVVFRDAEISISSATDGYLDLTADTGIRLNRTTTLGTNAEVTKEINLWPVSGGGYTNNRMTLGYGLDDTSAESNWARQQIVPLDFKAGSDATFYIIWYNKTTQVGGDIKNAYWRGIWNSHNAGVMGADTWESYITTPLTANQVANTIQKTEMGTMTGLVAGDVINTRAYRNPTIGAPADTMLGDLVVIAYVVEYTADKLGE